MQKHELYYFLKLAIINKASCILEIEGNLIEISEEERLVQMSILVFILDKIGGAIVSLPVIMLLAFLFDRKRAKQKWGMANSVYIIYECYADRYWRA